MKNGQNPPERWTPELTTDESALRDAAGSLPPYDEWRKLPPDDAARILAKARGLDAEQEGLIAAILEHFREENVQEHPTEEAK